VFKREDMSRLILLLVPTWMLASPPTQLQLGSDGSVLVVRSIRVAGNESTRDYIILREMSTAIGDTLNLERLEYDKNRIYSLGLFNRVDIDYAAQGSEAELIVRVHERWYIYPFPVLGFKYRDLKKFYYGAGVAHLNFRGRNERLIGEFAFGYDRWIQFSYQNPKLTADDDIFFRISGSWSRVQNLNPDRGTYQQEAVGGSITLGKRFGLYHLLTGSFGYESWRVSGVAIGRTISPDGRDAFPSVGGSYTFDTRDVKEYPTNGFLANVQATKNGFGSGSVNILRYGYDARVYVLLNGGTSLAGRTHGQFASGGAVPPYRYTYFGYGERLRGYFDRIIEGEDIIGGNLELRIPLLSPRYYEFPYAPLPEFSVWRYAVYAGVFADAGKTWFRSEGPGGRRWYSGFGAGLHFLLPYSIIIRTEYAMNRRGVGQFIIDFGASF